MSSSAIEVNNVWKRYGLPIPEGLRKPLNRLSGKIAMPDQWALQDVSFKVERGDALGIIGRNGAGKSTMLKVLAGVTPATRGTVRMHGTIFPMIELNAGINPELTGRENIYLLGTIMGFTTQEISDRYDVIADFTELEEWLEKPVWQYSSGMKARLGFGVAMNIDAQILLIDEVLAVGDLPFKKKCYNRLEALTNEGAAVVFVSHNIRQVERLCDHVIYLKKGEIILAGDSQTVCQEYNIRAVREYQETISEELSDGAVIRSSGEMELVRVETLDLTGRVTETFNPGDPFKIRICYDAHERIENPIIGANIMTSEMIKLTNFQIVPSMVEQPFYALEGEGVIEFTIPHMPFNPDCYTVGVTIRSENGRRIISGQSLATFCVEYDPDYATRLGLVHLDFSWDLNP